MLYYPRVQVSLTYEELYPSLQAPLTRRTKERGAHVTNDTILWHKGDSDGFLCQTARVYLMGWFGIRLIFNWATD